MYPRSLIAPSKSDAEVPPPPHAVNIREATTSRLANDKRFFIFSSGSSIMLTVITAAEWASSCGVKHRLFLSIVQGFLNYEFSKW
jgi:hypothetical protein